MNDQERRRSPDGFDDDAIFADIVAHLNDEASEADQTVRPAAEDAGPHIDTADKTTDETTPDSTTPDSTDLRPGDGRPGDRRPGDRRPGDRPPVDQRQWPINPAPGPPTPIDPQVDPGPQVWRAHEVDDEHEEHFEPPPVTPLPAGDLQFWAIIAGMTGGPLLLVYLVFFNRNASSYWILFAIAMSVGGFWLLVSRMPGQHNDDDDGARL